MYTTFYMKFLKKHTLSISIVFIILFLIVLLMLTQIPQKVDAPENEGENISSFEENRQEKNEDINIILMNPTEGQEVESPLTVKGEARGYWFFEGDFDGVIVDWNGKIIGEGYFTAQSEWMTHDFVPFEGEISFSVDDISGQYSRNGTLILHKANPSGLSEHSEALEIPIVFK
jgi:hypothetical protein